MSNVEEFPISALRWTEFEAIVAAAPSVLEAIPGAVYVCDHDGWVVCYNSEAAMLWGRQPSLTDSKERFCGSHLLFFPDGTPLPHEECPMADAVKSGTETRNAEVVIERPDGTRITALVNVRPLRDRRGQIQGAINCFQDITSQRATEDEARRSSADLEDFFENSAVGLHIVRGDGIIQRANKAELELLGYAPEEYVGGHIAEFHADAPIIGDILHRLSCGEKPDRYSARLRAKDGSIKHVQITSSGRFENGRLVGTRCFTNDVTATHDAEAALWDTRERLAATYQAATIGIAEANAEGRILRANAAFGRMLGYSVDQLAEMTIFDYTSDEDRDKEAAAYGKQVRGETDSYQLRKRAVKADGMDIYLDVHSSSVRGVNGEFLYGVRIIVDVTEAKRLEDRLREREMHMRELLEALPAAVYTTDAQGRIDFYNRAAVELAGRTPQIGDEWCVTWRLYRPDGSFLPHDECPMAIALKEGRPIRGEEAIAERPDGTRVPFSPYPTPLRDNEGNVVGAVNMLVDISATKKAHEYADRLAAIVEYSDDAIISLDTEGFIQTFNKGAERLFGYAAQEVIGKLINILIPPDRQDEEPGFLARVQRGEHVDHYETVRMKKDGTLLDISLTISPLRNAKGEIVGASKIARDVTERRREEQRRKLLVNELNHRVKNTLATVQSLASQTFRGEGESASLQRFENRLVALARAHDLLTRESWEGADIRELLLGSIGAVCVEPSKRFDISGPSFRLRPKLALGLSMAFHELATNAAKYGALSSEEGKIHVRWNTVATDNQNLLQLRWYETGGPAVKSPREKGFGSRLLERALARELGAKAELSFPEAGVTFSIVTPLA
ncbi:PAS domain S-box protein [Rhizobium sp. BR 362]|uniref:PAS domain S-box protein n=1 Tax=Rhizobium sp. BR 362 TaxID=3040670 RepID=UPI002F41EF66